MGRRTTYGHKYKRQGGTDRSGNKKIRLEQDVQKDFRTRRLSRRAQEKKVKEKEGDGGRI